MDLRVLGFGASLPLSERCVGIAGADLRNALGVDEPSADDDHGQTRIMTAPRVTKQHFIDAGEPDADGYWGFYYAYHEFEIRFGARLYGVRVYENESTIGFVHTAPSPRRAERSPGELRAV